MRHAPPRQAPPRQAPPRQALNNRRLQAAAGLTSHAAVCSLDCAPCGQNGSTASSPTRQTSSVGAALMGMGGSLPAGFGASRSAAGCVACRLVEKSKIATSFALHAAQPHACSHSVPLLCSTARAFFLMGDHVRELRAAPRQPRRAAAKQQGVAQRTTEKPSQRTWPHRVAASIANAHVGGICTCVATQRANRSSCTPTHRCTVPLMPHAAARERIRRMRRDDWTCRRSTFARSSSAAAVRSCCSVHSTTGTALLCGTY